MQTGLHTDAISHFDTDLSHMPTSHTSAALARKSRIVQRVAWVLIAAGLVTILIRALGLREFALVAGAGLVLIGSLLDHFAVRAQHRAVLRDLLRSEPVVQLLGATVPTVPPNIPISSLVEDYGRRSDGTSFPVIDNNSLVGLVWMQDVNLVPRDRWDTTEVGEIMISASHLAIIKPRQLGSKTLDKHALNQQQV